MSFVERMAAGERVADRYRRGEIDRDTAALYLMYEFEDTVMTTEAIFRFLDDRAPAHTED